MLLDLEIHIRGVDQPIKFLEMAKGEWSCERIRERIIRIAATNGNQSAMQPFVMRVRGASNEQMEIIYNVFNDANESNLKAFRDCNWTGTGIDFITDAFVLSREAYRTIESFRS